jgi:hypothetical protein
MIIQDHTSLDGLTDDNLSTTRAIGVDYITIMHPHLPDPTTTTPKCGTMCAGKSSPTA